VGLPGQTGLPGGADDNPPPVSSAENSSLGLIVFLGLCMVCLAGLLFFVLIIAGVVVMFRKR
jgi:hypothetical protein